MAGALVALAACQPLSRPFAPPDHARPNPLVQIKHGAGLAVLDLDGAPEPTARAVTDALIKALLARDIPAAMSAGGRSSPFVYGQATAKPAADGRVAVEAVWNLVDPQGEPLGVHRTTARPTRAAWAGADPAMVKALADEAAEGIAALVRGEDPAARPSQAHGVFIEPIRIASGLDGGVLRRALAEALPAGTTRLGARPRPDDLRLAGTVTLGPPIAGRRRLQLGWRLRRPDGREIGRLDQGNDVAIAALETDWPVLADLIAKALAPDIRGLIARAN